jgi:prepilin-type N-terminal cleavage/methylation domain-containing protein
MRRKMKGFTLVEVMISIVILLIGIFGVWAYFIYSKNALELAVKKRYASQICHMRLEELRSVDYNALSGYEETNTPVKIDNLDGFRNTVVENIDENNDGRTDYKKITVRVNWNQNGKEQKIEFVSFISPY